MRKESYFWISYSDLMTSLFFIMLVLFVVTIGFLQVKIIENERLISELKTKEEGLIRDNEKLKKLLRLEEQFAPLENDSDFIYLKDCKKFIVRNLMGVEIFDPRKTVIKPEYLDKALLAGQKMEVFVKQLNEANPDLSYLLVIEGNMANRWDQSIDNDETNGYLISYQRALAVYSLWTNHGIDLRRYNMEVMLCGSGFSGLCRDDREENNKRFSIQIIPKVSK